MNTVKIMNVNYKINETDKVIFSNNDVCFGAIDLVNQEIDIMKSMGDDRKFETLLHEILHGAVYEYNINIESADEEIIVDAFARALVQILKDNKDLYKHLI